MYGISYQKAGLNWPGRYKAWSRERALANAWRAWMQRKRTGVGCRVSGVGNGTHEKWRRITGITGAVEQRMTAKERRKGLKRLVERIKAFATEDTENTEENSKNETRTSKETQNGETEDAGVGCRVSGGGNDGIQNAEFKMQNGKDVSGQLSVVSDTPSPGTRAARSCPPSPHGGEGEPLSLTAEWGGGVETWARTAREGRSVESVCVELQISRARLTMLTKEYCGLTAHELVDGFSVRRVKSALIARLREAAESLWGLPGVWASWKMDGFRVSGFGFRGNTTTKRSKYFRMRPEDFASEERWAERERRIGELAAAVRREFDLETWAAGLGFASGARLKRACLNVLGKSLRALERAMAAEVVRYYICAEDKVLRKIACLEEETANVIRARWIYHKSDDAPTEPFLDEWSKAEELARDWLERMRREFG